MRKPKPHNSGQWTDARKRSFIMSALRKARWPVKYSKLKEAQTERKTNKTTGRIAMHYLCADCGEEFPATEMSVDHIVPVVPVTGFDSWDGVIDRMFCEADGLQALCKTCHQTGKTNKETLMRKNHSSIRRSWPLTSSSYYNMLTRCHNPKSPAFKYYGARGITVCDRWKESFHHFLEDMGERPSPGHSLDRKDHLGNYEASNCRWATSVEQARNTSSNSIVTYGNESMCVSEWGERLGMKPNTITCRLRRGWTVPQALEFEKRVRPSSPTISRDDVIMLVKLGLNQTQIAEELECHSSQVSRICAQLRLVCLNHRSDTKSRLKKKAQAMKASGCSQRYISETLGVSQSTVSNYIKN